MKKILVLNGPNLNMTGIRKKNVYGAETLDDINAQLKAYGDSKGAEISFYQSNHEGEIIDKLHLARKNYDGVILNAGAYTHYSYAIRDAIAAIKIPVVEVHLSNIHSRDEFRHTSVIAPVCVGQISGFGKYSYHMAVDALYYKWKNESGADND